jgi:transposase
MIFYKKLPNSPEKILSTLEPFKPDLANIAVESTYNWYWIVDLLMDQGYTVHLANPAAMKKYSGIKYSDDKHDAFWLAEMSRLGILPQGYIYPKEERPTRDLCRKRLQLVDMRTAIILSLKSLIARNIGQRISAENIKKLSQEDITEMLSGHEDLMLRAAMDKVAIDNFSGQIKFVESSLKRKIKSNTTYVNLMTMPGIGPILSLTILLETGPVERFKQVGNYASYCRKVDSKWTSNNKNKGKGNTKNGNRYLAWAFSEAAEHARMCNQPSAFLKRRCQRPIG